MKLHKRYRTRNTRFKSRISDVLIRQVYLRIRNSDYGDLSKIVLKCPGDKYQKQCLFSFEPLKRRLGFSAKKASLFYSYTKFQNNCMVIIYISIYGEIYCFLFIQFIVQFDFLDGMFFSWSTCTNTDPAHHYSCYNIIEPILC